MTKQVKNCAVEGVLMEGRALCGHHIASVNECGEPGGQCEHQVEENQEQGQQENES